MLIELHSVFSNQTLFSQPPQSPTKQTFQKQSVSDKKKFFETAMEESQKPSKPGEQRKSVCLTLLLHRLYFQEKYSVT